MAMKVIQAVIWPRRCRSWKDLQGEEDKPLNATQAALRSPRRCWPSALAEEEAEEQSISTRAGLRPLRCRPLTHMQEED